METNSGFRDAKAEASANFNKINRPRRRRRPKRELIDLALGQMDVEQFEELVVRVHGSDGWARLAPGSVKLVKRLSPRIT